MKLDKPINFDKFSSLINKVTSRDKFIDFSIKCLDLHDDSGKEYPYIKRTMAIEKKVEEIPLQELNNLIDVVFRSMYNDYLESFKLGNTTI